MTGVNLKLISRTALGAAWAGNSVNCVPYRYSALLYRNGRDIVSFFDPAGGVAVVEFNHDRIVARYDLKNVVAPHDAHQAISMGIDPSGRLHLAWGAHNSVLQTATSYGDNLDDGFALDTINDDDGVTYPMFLPYSEELLFVYRRGPHFRGELMVNRLDGDPPTWMRDPSPILSGIIDQKSCGPYINTPIFAADGRIVLFIVWRLIGTATSAGAVVNAGIDCMASSDGLRSLETFSGVAIKGTVVPAYSERVIPTPLGGSLINQGSAAVMPDGRPAVLTYWDAGDGTPQFRMGWPATDTSGVTAWRVATLSQFCTKFRLDGGGTLPLPHSRPALLFDKAGNALVLFRSVEYGNRLMLSCHVPPDYNAADEPVVLINEDLDFYEPIVSQAAWDATGELVMYVQRCAQGINRDGESDHAEAPAWLLRWKIDASGLASPTQPRRGRFVQALSSLFTGRGNWS